MLAFLIYLLFNVIVEYLCYMLCAYDVSRKKVPWLPTMIQCVILKAFAKFWRL